MVDQRTLLEAPFHSDACDLMPSNSRARLWRKVGVSEAEVGSSSGGINIMKESSVSIWADLELRFVDPNKVRKGKVDDAEDSHIPAVGQIFVEWKLQKSHLWRDRSTLAFPIHVRKRRDPLYRYRYANFCQSCKQRS